MINSQHPHRILILTQKVDINDDVLGFFHGWLKEFAKHCERVTVVALGVGKYNLPPNVKVLSLGKEKLEIGNWKLEILKKLKFFFNFYRYIWQERKDYDAVFVHMNPEYAVLGGLFWRAMRKKTGLWYVHKAVNLKLRLAEKLMDIIFTASPESFGIKSKKVNVVGHGIDLEQFSIKKFGLVKSNNFRIVYVGRISKIKNQELLIRAIDILVNKQNITNIEVHLVGNVIYSADKDYLNYLKELVRELKLEDVVIFAGSVPNKDIANIYRNSDLSVNLCPTGGMDKAVLESLACNTPNIVLNKTFSQIFFNFPELLLEKESVEDLSSKIKIFMKINERQKIAMGNFLRNEIADNYSLQNLITRILGLL